MSVTMPVACPDMDFNITRSHFIAYANLCIEKIGPGIMIQATRVYDMHTMAIDCKHFFDRPQPMLPYVLHQSFHRSYFANTQT